ncbi:Hypothetical protein CINCED_3A023524 [Cinara cedri]|uniref:Uncharacterized protein n=1 Tax=Cinara cedri TaxID=506608 RepID=A0A5E4MK71_9HEMI|nr:Hypothetical protein CINCED_3A023524 [Cinara cedri]
MGRNIPIPFYRPWSENAGVSGHVWGKLFKFKCLFCEPNQTRNRSHTHTTAISLATSTTVRTTTEFITPSSTIFPNNGTDIPEILPKSEDVISFFSSEITLKNISFEGKRSAFSLLCTSGLITNNQIPPVVIVNIIKMMASSNNVLGIFYDEMMFNAVLKMITNHPCVLNSVSTKVRIRFLYGLLSLSPGILSGIPKPAFISILGMISSPNVLTALPLSSTMNLITALSLSKPVFNCLPDETFLALLKFFVAKSPKLICQSLPPSTIFSFYEGIFDRINNELFVYGSAILPKSLIIEIISPIMTSRMLSVFPIHMYDKLLKTIESCPKEFPTSNMICLFTVLTKSPIIFNSLNPYYLTQIALAVSHSMPKVLTEELEISMAYYLPSAQNFFYGKKYPYV